MTTATLGVLYSPTLSDRQESVVRELASGKQVKQVARSLGVREEAVQRTIVRVARRLPGPGRPLHKVLLWAHRLLGGGGG